MTISDKADTMRARQHPKNPWGALQTLNDLADAGTGRTVKEEILKANSENDYLVDFLSTAYSSTNFYIRLDDEEVEKLAEHKKNFPPKDGTGRQAYTEFMQLADRLSNRKITGNEARESTMRFLEDKSLNRLETLFYARTLNHDLRIGIQAGTLSKVFPKMYKISRTKGDPTYMGCMLAAKPGERGAEFSYPGYADRKMDGIRLTLVSDKNGCRGFTRGGNFYPSLEHLEKFIHKTGFRGVLDVEAMANNWNESFSLISKRTNITPELVKRWHEELNLFVFDYIPLDAYYETNPGEDVDAPPLKKRRKVAKKLVSKWGNKHIRMVTRKVVKNEKELLTFYKKVLGEGFEGIMWKNPNGAYHIAKNTGDRPPYWIKLKPEDTETVIVTGTYEGRGKYRGMLGGFWAKSTDGKRHFRVGGKMSDDQRRQFWKIKKKLVGSKIDILVQDESGTQADIIARYPRFDAKGKNSAAMFERFRDDLG